MVSLLEPRSLPCEVPSRVELSPGEPGWTPGPRGWGGASLGARCGRLQAMPAGGSGNSNGGHLLAKSAEGVATAGSQEVQTLARLSPLPRLEDSIVWGWEPGGPRRPGLRVTQGADGRPAATPQPSGSWRSLP